MISLLLLVACGGTEPTSDAIADAIPGALPNGGEVIHTAHGVEVRQDLLDAFLSGLTEEQAEQANQASNRIRLASELAKTELLYQEAIKRGLHQKESTLAQIQIANRELLVTILKEEILESGSTDEAIQAYYDKRIMQFKVDQRELELIATPDLETATRLKSEIEGGADFAALALEHSVDERSKADGGKIGWVPLPSLVPDVASEIEGAAEGSVVGPISLGGAHGIFRVGGTRDLIPIEDVKEGIAEDPQFKASVLEEFIVELGGDATPTLNPALLQGLDQLPSGMNLPAGHPGGDHAGHNH